MPVPDQTLPGMAFYLHHRQHLLLEQLARNTL
jgi:hypothetical protein